MISRRLWIQNALEQVNREMSGTLTAGQVTDAARIAEARLRRLSQIDLDGVRDPDAYLEATIVDRIAGAIWNTKREVDVRGDLIRMLAQRTMEIMAETYGPHVEKEWSA